MRSTVAQRFFALTLALAAAVTSRGAGLAEPLLQLSPPDAGITLTIEDLRGHTQEFLASPLADRLTRLPFVRSWVDSPQGASFQAARRQIESVLGATLGEIRDELLGDAVVLTLRLPPQGRQEEARGMLLVRVRDRKLLDRLIKEINDAQKKKGELLRVEERTRNGITYQVREFAPRTNRPAEYYTVLADQTFAWSNSEELVQGVIERSRGTERGLSDVPGFRQVRERLPERSLASLFINPRFLESQIAAAPKLADPSDERLATILVRYVSALEYLGAALEWRRSTPAQGAGLIFHTEEVIDPEKLPGWLKHWAARAAVAPALDQVPASALAVVSAHFDFEGIPEILRAITPSSGQRKLDNLLLSLRGILLGRDLGTEILPHLGPAVVAYVMTPTESARGRGLLYVLSLDLKEEPSKKNEVAAALENGFRTFLALYALDEKHGKGQLEVESREIQGFSITSLSPTSPFAFAIARGRLILGGTAEAIATAISSDTKPNRRFAQLRADYFPQAETFLCVDLEKVRIFVESRRTAIARRLAARNKKSVGESERELGIILSLMGEFRDVFVSSTIAPDARSAHRMLGLIAPQEPASTPP